MKTSGLSILVLCSVIFGSSVAAQASSCKVPLRNVLVADADCAYYETAFRMMATSQVSVHSVCEKGIFHGPGAAVYNSQVLTTLTVHETSCSQMTSLELNPVLLSKPFCANLKNAVGMLSTQYIGVDPVCSFGSWVGADGSPRTSKIATRMLPRSSMAQR